MKKILILILALCLLVCGCANNESPSTEAPETEAPAIGTQAEETVNIPDDQEAVTEPPKDTVTVYLLTRMASLDENGNELWYEEYSYDELGRLAKTLQYSDGIATYSSTTTYLSDTEYETAINAGGTEYTMHYTCDEAGRVLYQEMVQDGTVTETNTYTYDSHGSQLTLQIVYNGEWEVNFSFTYTYDDSGNKLTCHEYQDNELIGWQEMEYDADGREIASVYIYPDGSVSHSTACTWEGNTEIRTQYDETDTLSITTLTTYDDAGNILRQETQQDGVVISSTEYTYEPFEIPAE